jgi:hypothetical protein
MELAPELVMDLGPGALVAWIPFVGGGIAALFDAVIAHKLTWRVARMAELYFANDCAWVESRSNTYKIAKGLDEVDLDDIPEYVSGVMDTLTAAIMPLIRTVEAPWPGVSDDEIVQILHREHKLKKSQIRKVLARRRR